MQRILKHCDTNEFFAILQTISLQCEHIVCKDSDSLQRISLQCELILCNTKLSNSLQRCNILQAFYSARARMQTGTVRAPAVYTVPPSPTASHGGLKLLSHRSTLGAPYSPRRREREFILWRAEPHPPRPALLPQPLNTPLLHIRFVCKNRHPPPI